MRDRRTLDESGTSDRIEHLPGGAHPGAKHGAVRGFVMMGVVRFVRNRLRGRQSSDRKQRKDQQHGDRLLYHTRRHSVGDKMKPVVAMVPNPT